MIGSYDPEGSSYGSDLSLVKCKSRDNFEIPMTSVTIDNDVIPNIQGKSLVIDPSESFISMDFYDFK